MKSLFFNVPSDLQRDAEFASMTSEQLKVALDWRARKAAASKNNSRQPPQPSADQVGVALKFLDRIKRANRRAWATEEEKSGHRASV
jgi:hypothetical protein